MAKIIFDFKVSRLSNLYFFIQNMSEWHYSNVAKYNQAWLEKGGKLSKEEKAALNNFRDIRRSEPSSNSIFERAFYKNPNPLKLLESELSEKDFENVNKAIKILESRFENIYREELPRLKKWQALLSRVSNDSQNALIQKTLEIFYNEKIKKDKKLTCHLLIAPIGHSGSSILDGSITQEVSNLPSTKLNDVLATIWHETIHAFFDKHYLKELLQNMSIEENDRIKITEIMASSLFPYGVLGKNIFNLPITDNLYPRYRVTTAQTQQIIQLVNDYTEHGLVIDTPLVKNIQNILEK